MDSVYIPFPASVVSPELYDLEDIGKLRVRQVGEAKGGRGPSVRCLLSSGRESAHSLAIDRILLASLLLHLIQLNSV